MTARVLGRVLVVVVLVASGAYFLVYLYRWQWNRALVSGLFFVAAEIAVVASVVNSGPEPAVGAELIVTTGGVMSPLVHSWTSGVGSTLPAGLLARTWKTCSPCGMSV